MGFFYNVTRGTAKKAVADSRRIPIDTMRKIGCGACPLDKAKLTSPKMQPVGSERPLIYILGEAPGENEDLEGEPFVGKSGKLLKSQFPQAMLRRDIRIGNTIRCRPPENRTPEFAEVECCRFKVQDDIEHAAPTVLVGTGNVPLNWATGLSSITAWRGKLIATRIGQHDCWYYPVLHPSFVLRKQGKYRKSEYELCFEHDLRWLVENADRLHAPTVYDAPYDKGIELIEGRGTKDFNRLEDILNELAKEPSVAIDLETGDGKTGLGCLRPYVDDPKIFTCAIGTFGQTVAFPMDHPEGWDSSLRRRVWGLVAEFLLGSGKKIAHHLGFELEWLTYFYGRELTNLTEWEDTMAQAHTLDERIGTLSLDDLTRQHFGFFLKDQSKVDPKRLLEYPIRDALRYNGMDSKWTHLLHDVQRPMVEENPMYVREYERKLRLEPALVLTQQKGILVDFNYAKEMETKLVKDLAQIELKLERCPEINKYKTQFGTFLASSPDHVLKLMKDVCKRDEIRREDGGTTSDEAALSKIPEREVPSAPLILEHRSVMKLAGTYITPLLAGRNTYSDGRMHPKFSSMVAVTGRLACEDPNAQNFPKRKHKEIRGVVVPPPGEWIAAADYGQLEARVIGMASRDDALCRSLWTGYDIHGFWADRFMDEYPRVKDRIIKDYKVDGDDMKLIRKKFRDEIKNGWVFPQFFGSAVRSCAESLQIPDMIAEDLAREFWDEFKGVKEWQEWLLKRYEKNLYVETLTGRRRRGPQSKNEIINAPIQGTAADIVTESMAELSEMSVILDDERYQPNINVHDDLTTNLPDEGLEGYLESIARVMCRHRFDFINVPLIIEFSVGDRWHTIQEVAVYRSNELYNIRSPYA